MAEPTIKESYQSYYAENDPAEVLLRQSLRDLGRDMDGQPLPPSPMQAILEGAQAEGGGEEEAPAMEAEEAAATPEPQPQLAFPATQIETPEGALKRAAAQQAGTLLGKEIPVLSPTMRRIAAGSQAALVNMAKTFDDFTAFFKDKAVGTPLEPATSIFPTKLGPLLEKHAVLPFPPAQGIPGKLVENTMQFLTAFSAYTAGLGALGVGTLAASIPANFAASFSAFDPQSPNIANMLRDLAPPLRGPVLDFLATDPADGGAEERLRERLGTAIAETIPNVAIEGVVGAVKMIRSASARPPGLPPGRAVPKLAEHFATEGESVAQQARAFALNQADRLATPEGFEGAVDTLVRTQGVDPAEARRVLQNAMGSPGQLALGLVEQHLGKLAEPATLNAAIEQLQQLTNVSRDDAARLLSETYGAAFGTPGFFQGRLQEGAAGTRAVGRQLPQGAPTPRQLTEGRPLTPEGPIVTPEPRRPLALPPAPVEAIPLPAHFATERGMAQAVDYAQFFDDLLQSPDGRTLVVEELVSQTGVTASQADTLLHQAQEVVANYRGTLPARARPSTPMPARFAPEQLTTEARKVVLEHRGAVPDKEMAQTVNRLVAATGSSRTAVQAAIETAEQDLVALRAAHEAQLTRALETRLLPPPATLPPPPPVPLPAQFAQASAPELATRLVIRGGKAAETPEGIERSIQAIVQQTGLTRAQAESTLNDAFDRVRGLLQGATPDDLPPGVVDDIVRELKREAPPEVLSYFGQEGFSQLGVMIGLARAGIGGVVGGAFGETPEERIRNAMIGAGIGALASPALLRRLTQRAPSTPVEAEIATAAQTIRREALGKSIGERVSDTMASAREAAALFAQNIVARSGRVAADVMANTGETIEAQAAQMRAIRQGMQAAGTVPENVVRDVNYSKLLTTDDIKRTIAAVGETLETDMTAARKLGTPQEETKRLASLMGLTVDDLLARGDGAMIDSRVAYASQVMLLDSATELDRLATLVQQGNTEAYQDFLKQFVLHGEIQKTAAAIRSEAGRTLGILRASRSGTLEYYETIQNAMERVHIPATGEGVTAERLAEMVKGLTTPQAVNTFVRQATAPTKTQAFIEAYVNGLLSGPQTHVTQLVSNALTTVWAVPERFMTVATAKLMREEASFGEAAQMAYGMIEGYMDAFKVAAAAFRGEGQFGHLGRTAELHKPAIVAETFGLARTTPLGRGIEYLGNVIRTPTRALDAVDEVFKSVNYRMMLRKEAFTAAQQVPDAERAEFIARFLADPPVDVVDKARNFAFYQTFQNSLGAENVPFARLGQGAGHIQRFAASHPLFKIFVPFVRTPTNILRYTFERTPGLALASREVRASLQRGGVDAAEAMAKMELGAAMIGITAYLGAQGYITGPGSRHPNLQQDMQGMGFRPWSLRVPGTESLIMLERSDPLSNFLIQGATLSQLVGAAPEANLQEAALGTLLGFMKAFSNKSFLTGFSQIVDILSGRGETVDAAMKGPTRALSRVLQGFEPALLRQLERAIDPEVRESQSLLDGLMAVTPGVSDSLPVTRNNLAQPVLYGHGNSEGLLNAGVRFLSPFPVVKIEQERANKLLIENGLDLDKPLRNFEGVELTPQEYEQYLMLARDGLKIAGKTFKERLEDWYDSPQFRKLAPGPEGEQSLRIRGLALQYGKLARAVMLNPNRAEYAPELAKRVRDERIKTQGQRRGVVAPDALEPGLEHGQRVLDLPRRPRLAQ